MKYFITPEGKLTNGAMTLIMASTLVAFVVTYIN